MPKVIPGVILNTETLFDKLLDTEVTSLPSQHMSDIPDKIVAIMNAASSDTSIYQRTKLLLNEAVEAGNITSAEKADMLVKIMSDFNNSITTAAITGGLQWAFKEKEFAYKKVELLSELESRDFANYKTKAEVDLNVAKQLGELGKLIVNYVKDAEDKNTDVVASIELDKKGSKLEKELATAEILKTKASKEVAEITEKIEASKATTYKLIADTYANFGNIGWNWVYSGFSGKTAKGITVQGVGAYDAPLVEYQKELAREQAKGYSRNYIASLKVANLHADSQIKSAHISASDGGNPPEGNLPSAGDYQDTNMFTSRITTLSTVSIVLYNNKIPAGGSITGLIMVEAEEAITTTIVRQQQTSTDGKTWSNSGTATPTIDVSYDPTLLEETKTFFDEGATASARTKVTLTRVKSYPDITISSRDIIKSTGNTNFNLYLAKAEGSAGYTEEVGSGKVSQTYSSSFRDAGSKIYRIGFKVTAVNAAPVKDTNNLYFSILPEGLLPNATGAVSPNFSILKKVS